MKHTLTSPWLSQLRADRPHFSLQSDITCTTAIIGAGISGVATAYHVLRYTKNTVALLDAGRIAHGATGRNAGQVVSEFEKPLLDLATLYGSELAADAQRNVDDGWMILEEMLTHCKLRTPLHECSGYTGLRTIEQIIEHAEENIFKKDHDLYAGSILVWTDASILQQLPEHVLPYITPIPHSTLLTSLKTEDTTFIAAATTKIACINSALFCEEVIEFLLHTYPDRLTVAEHTPVHTVDLYDGSARLQTSTRTVTANTVVLCTNGYENITVTNTVGEAIDARFHHMVEGYIGYMTGYLNKQHIPPTALAYLDIDTKHEDPYVYLTRRPYENNDNNTDTLVCLGGPERPLPDRAEYNPQSAFPADIEEELDRTLENTYVSDEPLQKAFAWQGLMGYTNDGIRKIGYEPRNKVLLYNIGCNGVGILPSLYGGKRIAQLLDGVHLAPSLFDPS